MVTPMKYPGARWRPLPEQGTQRAITPTQLVLHSAVGRGSIFGYLAKTSVVVESTWWVGLDGKVEQYMSAREKAEAQWLGNPRALSVETADNGDPDTFPWTREQVEALAQLAAWCHVHLGIPLRLCRSWDDPGIGYHRLFPQWNPNKHSCPGTVRIAQVEQIIARARQLVAGVKPATPAHVEDDDMQPTDKLPLGPGNRANLSKALGRQAPDAFTVADALTLGVLTAAKVADLQAAQARQFGELRGLLTAALTAAGAGVDLAAVEAAAKRGAQDALDGAEIRLTPGD